MVNGRNAFAIVHVRAVRSVADSGPGSVFVTRERFSSLLSTSSGRT